jgi:hypothetical protein
MSNSAKWYRFDQNNSGGFYLGTDEEGVGGRVYVQAFSPKQARERFEALNPYVCELGFVHGRDCECCGGRWYADEEVEEDFLSPRSWGSEGTFAHPLDGPFYRVEGVASSDE